MHDINALNDKFEEGLWLAVDSGASENVIPTTSATLCPTTSSSGSRAGVRYIAANGETMPNRGEKALRVVTEEGNRCTLKMQVTDVTKPLMSVSKICDAGHEVTFTSGGGYIMHLETKQRTEFRRVDNVYRLRVAVPFGGQGM